jgi:WD40 repeat protein
MKSSIMAFSLLLMGSIVSAQTIDWTQKANPLFLSVNGVAFRSDGQKVISGTNCHPAAIRMYDVSTAALEWDYNVGMTYMCIMGLTFSSNTGYIVAIEEFGNIFIFDNTGATPVILDTINTGTSYGFSTAISPSNDKVAVGCSNGKLKIYNLADGSLSNDINAHPSWVTTVNYAPNGSRIVTGGSDDKVKIWSTSGSLLFTCNGHTGDITNVKISPDNQYVVSSSKDNSIKIWELSTGILVRTITGHLGDVNGIDVSPDGSWIVSGSSDSTCKIWNFNSGVLVSTFGVPDSGAVNTVSWSPSGDKIVTGNSLSDVVLWSIPSALGTGEEKLDNDLIVFPNPAQGNLSISIPFSSTNNHLYIYNELGQLQYETAVLNSKVHAINLEGFSPGVYFLVLKNDQGTNTVRVIVNN